MEALDLRDCDISDYALQQLCNCKHLKKINVNVWKNNRLTITSEGTLSAQWLFKRSLGDTSDGCLGFFVMFYFNLYAL